MTSSGSRPEIIQFSPDLTTKKKKGVHRPIYAEVFTKDTNQGDAVDKVHLMINPYSGKKMGQKIAKQAKAAFEQQSIEVSVHTSNYSGELIELTAKLAPETSDVVVVIGGDGSLSEVITGLMQSNCQSRVGLIPAGTGNSMANDLRIKSTEEAIARICAR